MITHKSILVIILSVLIFGSAFAGQVYYDPIAGELSSLPDIIAGGVNVTDVSSNTTLNANQIDGGIIPLTGDGTTVIMPAVSSVLIGKWVTFYVNDATAKHIDVNGSDKITWLGVDLDDGDKLSIAASNEGKAVTFICISTVGWIALGDLEWTDGG